MQNPFMAAGGAVLFALGVAVGAGVFQDAKKEGGQDGANTMKPLDEHKWLASQVGTWKATMSMMTGPDQWERGVGTETVRMDCGGLWQISDFEMPKLGGMGAFKGHGVMGYDPDRKKFVGHWFDAWGYSPTAMEGTTDKDRKVLTVVATMIDPQSKSETKMTQKHVFTDEKTRTFSMSMDGPDGKPMEILKVDYVKM